jgi:putative membrane protein
MKKPGMAAVLMAVALFTYAVMARAQQQTADDSAGQADQGSAMQAGSQQQGQQQNPQEMQKRFVKEALSGNQFEVEAGKLAAQRAQRQEIKDFAQMLVKDHQQANQDLQPIAQQMGIESSEQQKLNPVHQAQLDELKQLQGQAFDRAWVYTQFADHQKDILCYRDVAQEAQDPQLKDYAQQTLPTLQQHLEHASMLAGVGQAGTASDIQRPADSPSGMQGDQSGQDSGLSGQSDQSGIGSDAGGQMDQGSQTGQSGAGQQ